MTRPRASSEIACGGDGARGCGALLRYPAGSPFVRCALCDHVTRASSAAESTGDARRRDFDDDGARDGDGEARARCAGCDVVMRFPADATHVRCAMCDAVSVNARAATRAPRASGTRAASALAARGAARERATRDVDDGGARGTAYVRCEGCRVTLAYPGGSASVRCSACGAVTRCAERATRRPTGGGSPVKSARGGNHAVLTSNNLVVVENPPTVSESGKIVSNIAVGVRLGENE